ncbi:MAG TPA: acyl-CoA-binding protein [Kofleriaceae bacterium]|nr:acyl-CoA-binding protein [Kofleriaceae bacterium]
MALPEEFEAAVKRVNGLPSAPPQSVMLDLYGLYKQATVGDATGKRPGITDLRGRAKYDAWAGRKGMSKEDAMRAYIEAAGAL